MTKRDLILLKAYKAIDFFTKEEITQMSNQFPWIRHLKLALEIIEKRERKENEHTDRKSIEV